MNKFAIFTGTVVAAVAAATILVIRAASPKDAPGFFGPGPLVADINLVLEILLVLGLTFGFLLARARNIEAHRRNQTLWVLLNAALVACIMVPAMRDVKLESLASLADPLYWVTWLHALLGLFTLVAGLWLVLQMNDVLPQRFHIRGWKNLMRATLAGYWAVALLGFATYYFWYVG